MTLISITDLASGERVGLGAVEITAVPHLSILQKRFSAASSDFGGDLASNYGVDLGGNVDVNMGNDMDADLGGDNLGKDLNGDVGESVYDGIDEPTDVEGFPPNKGFDGPHAPITSHFGDTGIRFGDPNGRYATDIGTLPEQCSIPPGNDLTSHPFVVLGDIPNVEAGTAAPWYGQDGGGKQYILPDTLENLNDPNKNPENEIGE